MKLEFFRKHFSQNTDTKFRENSSSWSRDVPCGRTDVKKLIVAIRNFANAPNKKKRRGGYTANTVCSHFNWLQAVRMVSNHAQLNSYLHIFHPDNIVTRECREWAAIPTECDAIKHSKPTD